MLKKILPYTLWVAVLGVVAVMLVAYEQHTLWKVQEFNLFLYTPLFLKQQMVVSGGLLTYLGTYFTQFFYYPWTGTLLLCAWWMLLMWLTKRAFRIADRWAVLLLVPVALLLLTDVDMGYWIYKLKLRGHFFVATIGTTTVAALLWGYRSLPARGWLRTVAIVLTAAVGYPLLGIYGLAATLLMGLWSWKLDKSRTMSIVNSIVAVLCAIAVPLLCYRYVYYETNLANIWYTALPLYLITDEHAEYYLPFWLLALCYVAFTLGYGMKPVKLVEKRWTWALSQVVLLSVMAYGIYRFWYKDENFHHETLMQHCVEQQDWQGVLNEAARQQDKPTRAIVMMRNLALSHLGRIGNEMYNYPGGSKKSNAPFYMSMAQVIGKFIYYHYGVLNHCHRLCMEEGVEYGWRAEHFKYMTRCALLDGETQVARKYINLLKQTRYFREWAEQQEKLIGKSREELAKLPEYGFIVHMLHYENRFGSDKGTPEKFLMTMLSTNYSDDPVFQEQSLVAALWMKDISTFWRHFFNYARSHINQPMPRIYQEAAYLYGHLENQVDISHMPFDKNVKENYDAMMNAGQQYNVSSEDQLRTLLYPRFGHTFYYEYFFMRDIMLY